MSEIFLTPEDSGEAIELSRTLMRKRILPKGSINYKGRTIVFDDAYLSQVAEAYKAGAYDQVPVQMADSDNRHTMDPERFGGEVVGVELGEDGLYGTFSFTERGAQLVKDNPKLGVSARLKGNYERSDGKVFPAAMQHVLLTQDPRIPGLGAWTEVNLSGYHDSDEIVDLTNARYEGTKAVADGTENETEPAVDEDKINALLTELGFDEDERKAFFADLDTVTADVDDIDLDEDTEVAKAAKENDAKAEKPAKEAKVKETKVEKTDVSDDVAETEEGKELVASLSNELGGDSQPTTVDLANDDLRNRLSAAEKQLAQSRFEAEKAKWVSQGVPPAFVDLAQPVLTAVSGAVIDLSNGPGEDNKVDAAAIMRKMIETTAGYVRLAEARGHDLTLSNEPEAEQQKLESELDNIWKAVAPFSKN